MGINKPFKDYVREEYRQWRMKNISFTAKGYIKKPGKKEFLQFVSKALEKITESVVQNSFYAARILDRNRPLPKVGDVVEVCAARNKEDISRRRKALSEGSNKRTFYDSYRCTGSFLVERWN